MTALTALRFILNSQVAARTAAQGRDGEYKAVGCRPRKERGQAIMRTAIYARVSTVDKGQEVENQLTELRRFAASQGWQIHAEYIDRLSAKTADRPQFKALF